MQVESYSINNGIIVSSGSRHSAGIRVENGRISDQGPVRATLDLGGDSFVYPALVNSHDHMRGNYLPRVGPNGDRYYVNWSYWDSDLKSSPTYEERSVLSVEQLYFLSAYKNLFSGVATVNDHFPHDINAPFIPRLPIRVIAEYCLAHECSSFELKWGDGMEIEHKRARERNWPFITHLEEGFDPESQDGIGVLERADCLDEYDLLVHCIGFSDEDIRKAAAAKVSVAWCPASNMFMFNTTCKIRKILKAGINVAIGTDSTHTGSVNLLEEARYARTVYRDLYGEDLSPRTIFEMITINPARAFRMEKDIGSLDTGKHADILVLKAVVDDPWENLVQATSDDIRLLTIAGNPVLGESAFFESLGLIKGKTGVPEGYERITIGKKPLLVKGNPAKLYKSVRKAVGFEKKLEYMPFTM